MLTYVGSGPYCYANSVAMMLGDHAPPVAVIETLTGSPFGMQLVGGRLPMFDPHGWDPEIGVDAALELLGWECERTAGSARLPDVPFLAGPLDLGLLPYSDVPPGVDHYVVVLGVSDGTVLLHDPDGHPYVTLPVETFLRAWEAKAITYGEPFTQRTHFTRKAAVSPEEALVRSIPQAIRWMETVGDPAAIPLTAETRGLLGAFGIRVGARRLADAATCLTTIGYGEAAAAADRQARALGALQHAASTGDDRALAEGLARLGPGYEALRLALIDGGTAQ